MCRLLLDDGLKAACILFWILDFGFWISGFGFRLADRCRLLSRFVARMKFGTKHRLGGFCDYLRHGRRVACNVDMVAAQRHAHRPNTPSAIQKAACTFPNGVQAAFLGVQRTCPLFRGRGSGFAVAAKGQPAFCGQCPNPICRLLFQICSKSIPSPAGEG